VHEISNLDLRRLSELIAADGDLTLEPGEHGIGPPKVMKNAFFPATTFHETVTLSFVIPSEAEGSAFRGTSRGNAEYYAQTELSSRPGA
jgi:hypothetical protein